MMSVRMWLQLAIALVAFAAFPVQSHDRDDDHGRDAEHEHDRDWHEHERHHGHWHTIGGTVQGLSGSGLMLQDNGGEKLHIKANGKFTFATPIKKKHTYSVTVLGQPKLPTQVCTVSNGHGTVDKSSITNILVKCSTTTVNYTIGGTVQGLNGAGLVLQDNGGDNRSISANGSFTFATPVRGGSTYAVSVLTQPSAQTCRVTNGSGTASANVTNVQIACTTNTYTVGGTVTGLSGSGLMLQDNGGDNLTVSANGSFRFATPVTAGASYAVGVLTQPTAQTCRVTNGSGTASTNVTNVQIACTTNTYTIGGTVMGLAGSGLVLQDNGGDNLTISANGSFRFAAPVMAGSSYAVTALAQPSAPSQTCFISGGSGTVSSANVMDVQVLCVTNTYTIGGGVQGLNGAGLVLQDNGGDNLSVSANGSFSFAASVASGNAYSVTVLSQPTAQTCDVANGAGTISSSNVTSVSVTCKTNAFTIGGTVQGLAGAGMVLRNNNGDDITVSANGSFTFATTVLNAGTYSVSVATQPASPAQSCSVSNGSGTVSGANVTGVVVNCPAVLYGRVTDAGGAALGNIGINAYHYGDRLAQTSARTDTNGVYVLNVPAGDYVMAAINDGTASNAASQWWTANGGTSNSHAAGKVSFGANTLARDFTLAPGARISGTITGGGAPLAGIRMIAREFGSKQDTFAVATAADGSYTLNIAPGDYNLLASNSTAAAFATQYFSIPMPGLNNATLAPKVSLTAGNVFTANMVLGIGRRIDGIVSDPSTGPMAGAVVTVMDQSSAFVDAVRTAADGSYALWVPGSPNYGVYARGQRATLNLGTIGRTANFGAAMGMFTATIVDAGGNSVPGVRARLYDSATVAFLAVETTRDDGSVTLYANPASSAFLELRNEGNAPAASGIYLNQTRLLAGNVLTAPAGGTSTALGNISLSSGAILRGVLTDTNGVPRGNRFVQIRLDTTSDTDRMLDVRSSADGSYAIVLPANATVARVCAYNFATLTCPPDNSTGTSVPGTWQLVDGVVMGPAGSTTTVNFAY